MPSTSGARLPRSNAELAKNPEIAADPSWEPLLVTPPHQEYPAAHCLSAGAVVAVLRDVLGGDKLATSYVYPPLGVLRQWDGLSQIATEVENARVWGGIHFRTADNEGQKMGTAVADWIIISHSLQPAHGKHEGQIGH